LNIRGIYIKNQTVIIVQTNLPSRFRQICFPLRLVSRLFLHVHTLQDKVLHFIFEAALTYDVLMIKWAGDY
jgi:hypothetical protein